MGWSIEAEGVEGMWKAACDIWFSITGAASQEGDAELMIWINKGREARPAGRLVATVEVNRVSGTFTTPNSAGTISPSYLSSRWRAWI